MRIRRLRRSSLAGIAVVSAFTLTAAGCGSDEPKSSSSGGLEKTTLNVGILPVADVTQLQLAINRGFFKAEGLTVKTQVLQGGAEAVPKLRAKNLDVSFGAWVPLFLAESGGAIKAHAIADAFQSADGTHVVMVRKDSPIKTAKDLAGKKIGINVKHNLGSLMMQAQLQPQGVKLDDDKNFVEVPFPQMLNALQTKSVDAVQAVEPTATQIEKAIGARKVLELSAGETAKFPIAGFFSTSDFAKDNPKTLAAFQRAVAKAQGMISTDQALIAQTVPTYTKIDAATAEAMHKGSYPTNLDPANLKRVSDIMVKYGYLKSPIDVNSLVSSG
jgi:NitT/TauT family transport system substrate-binding protein